MIIEQGCLMWTRRLVILPNLRRKTLKSLHKAQTSVTYMKALRRSFVWWPGMHRDIEKLVLYCKTCLINQAKPQKISIHHWERINNAWVRLYIGYTGPLLGKVFLIFVDYFPK